MSRVLRTVRGRLALAAAVAVTVVLAVAGAALVWALRSSLTAHLDESLSDHADTIAAQIVQGTLGPVIAPLGDDDTIAQVVDGSGRIVAVTVNGTGLLPLGDAPAGIRDTIRGVSLPGDDDPYRLLTRRVESTAGTFTVNIAANRDDVDEAVLLLVRSLLIVVPLAAGALAVTVWWLAGRALAPVESMRREVTRMSGGDLTERIPTPSGRDEIARLADTLNSLLDRIEDASAGQTRFVADASHELRSPLTRLRTEMEVDLAHPDTADLARTHASALEEVIAMQHLVDDLLVLARVDEGATPTREVVDLAQLVLTEARRRRVEARLTVDTSAVGPALVQGDPAQLARVIRNLADNADRHAHSTIWFVSEREGGSVVLRVADDGPGIPGADRERVFERFARLDEARTLSAGGTGLGLAIVRALVTAHRGTVEVREHVSGGAEFVVRLPTGAVN